MLVEWVFDIDDTVLDLSHRRHFIYCKPPNWPAFFDPAQVMKDQPAEWTQGLWRHGDFVYGDSSIFLTARSTRSEDLTRRSLMRNGFANTRTTLIMKKSKTQIPPTFKKHVLDVRLQSYPDTTFVLVDDDLGVIAACASLQAPNLRVVHATLDMSNGYIHRMADELGLKPKW